MYIFLYTCEKFLQDTQVTDMFKNILLEHFGEVLSLTIYQSVFAGLCYNKQFPQISVTYYIKYLFSATHVTRQLQVG